MAVQGLLNHPAMAPLAKTIGYIQKDRIKVMLFQYQQQQQVIEIAASTENPRGHPMNNQRSFIRSVSIASAPGPDLTNFPKTGSQIKKFASAISCATGYRWLINGQKPAKS
jgi:hypothetical protein